MYVHSFIENGLVVLKKNIKIWKVTTTITTTTTITNSVRKAHLSPTEEKTPFPPQKYDTFNLISTDYKAGSAGNSKAAVQLINFL